MIRLAETLRAEIRFLSAPYFVIEGPERATGDNLRVLWCGSDEHLAYFAKRIFASDNVSSEAIGRHSLRFLTRLIDRHRCQLAIVIAPENILNRAVEAHDFVLPLWVECTVDLDPRHVHPKSGDIRRSLKLFEKNNFACDTSTDHHDLEFFFESIYLPTISKSHGRAALPASLDRRARHLKRGEAELMRVTRDGAFIAGLILDYRQNTPALREIGVLDGSKDLKRRGIIPALNQHAFDYLQSRQYTRASLGMSRPFLDDGVLQFKRKFGPIITGQSDQNVLIRVFDKTAAVRSLLCANPCFGLRDGRLTRVFFQDTRFDTTLAVKKDSLLSWDFGIEAQEIVDLTESIVEDAAGEPLRAESA